MTASTDAGDATGGGDAAADVSRCPLCGGPNFCAMAAGGVDEDCWCAQIEFAPQALDRLPRHERGARCICPSCAVHR
jgi:hypothetical protein